MRVSGLRSIAVVAVIALVVFALPAMAFGAVTTYRVSLGAGGVQAGDASEESAVSGDGRYVAFESAATTLVAGDTNGTWDVFVRDRLLGTTERVSVATDGAQADADCYSPSISADGRFVAFYSAASNLVDGDSNGTWDVFVRDRLLGTTERASVATGGDQSNGSCSSPAISADGHHVAFSSDASNLVDADTNGFVDIFVRDLSSGTTERVSVAADGGQAGGRNQDVSISADGRFVAFTSMATTLVAGDTNGFADIFVRDRQLATTERVDVAADGGQTDAWSGYPSISADGRYVAFQSESDALVVGDTNGVSDVFVRDRKLGTTGRVSLTTAGGQARGDCWTPSISADGRYVAFASNATTLVAGDTNAGTDIFVRDRLAGITERVSVATDGAQGNADSSSASFPAISANGRCVVFDSVATNLVANDTNGEDDVFLADRGRLSISITRSPSASIRTYRRTHGVARFTLSATVKDSRGVRIAGARVYLQHSRNGRTGWHKVYTLTTNPSGVVSKAFKATKRSTTYYRWVVQSNDVRLGKTTGKQKIIVK